MPYPDEIFEPDGDPLEMRFDALGLLEGPGRPGLIRTFLTGLERRIDADGWDQPARLFAMLPPATTEATVGGDAVERLRARNPGNVTVAYSAVEMMELGGYPVEELWEVTLPDEAIAGVLICEVWATPLIEGALVGRQGPDGRVEMRSAMLCTRTGEMWALHHPRDGEEVFTGPTSSAEAEGLLAATLARVCGAPTLPSRYRPADLLGRVAIALSTMVIGHLGELAAADPGGEVTSLRDLFATTVLASFSRIAAPLCDDPSLADPELMLPAGELARAGAPAEQVWAAVPALRDAARELASRSFADLLPSAVAAGLVPPRGGSLDWCGPELLADALCELDIDDQPVLLSALGELGGIHVADLAAGLLAEVGWSDRAGGGG